MDLALEIDKYLNSKEDAARERKYFYVSEVGKSKKDIYDSFKSKTSFKTDAKMRRIFDNGDRMHERYFKYFAEMGILIAAELTAVENELFHGRADCIITDKKDLWVVDLKSCSMWTFNKLDDAQHDHKLQLQLYMYYLNIPRGMLLYENKNDQNMKIFKYELNRPMVEKIIEEFKVLKEQIDNNIVPPNESIKLEDIEYG